MSLPVLLLFGICACSPALRDHSSPGSGLHGWERFTIPAGPFVLTAYARPDLDSSATRLHIYLHGDGRAFLDATTVARNPSPRNALTAKLASADPVPALFLTRPCYFGTHSAPGCSSRYWTVERYAPTVINAVAVALERIRERYPDAELTVIGYSGGGVVGLLAAQESTAVSSVVTIAAPLDTAYWTELHGYTPLASGSNPADLAAWRPELRQWHLVGEKDLNVPPSVARSFMAKTHMPVSQADLREIPGFDHRCCWVDAWESLSAGSWNPAPGSLIPAGNLE